MALRAAVAAAFLTALTLPGAAETVTGFATGDVNLRSGPGSNYDQIRVIPRGAKVDILNCERWCRVAYGGHQGYAYGRYISAATDPPPRRSGAPARRQGYVEPLAPEYAPAQPLLPRSGYVAPLAPPRDARRPLRWDERYKAWSDGERWYYGGQSYDNPDQFRFGLGLRDPPTIIKRDPYGIPCQPLQRQNRLERPPLNC